MSSWKVNLCLVSLMLLGCGLVVQFSPGKSQTQETVQKTSKLTVELVNYGNNQFILYVQSDGLSIAVDHPDAIPLVA